MTDDSIQRLRDAVLRQLSAPASEQALATSAVRDAVTDCCGDPEERIAILADAQDWARQRAAEIDRAASTVHIRKKAGPNFGSQFYSHRHHVQFMDGYRDPQAETLCGGAATSYDMSWAETRFPKNRAHVECARCIEIRLSDRKVVQ